MSELETLAWGYGLVEGPRVDDENRLYFSDVHNGGVHRRNPDGTIEVVVPKRRGVGGIALHVWTIKGYFETIDGSLEEAAALDGATPWQAFRLVLLPLSVPILAVVFILSFIAAITEVPVASLLLRDVNSYTLAVGMQQYLNPQNYLWGDFAAAAVLSAIPITVVFLLAQRWLVNGLTAGGVKG